MAGLTDPLVQKMEIIDSSKPVDSILRSKTISLEEKWTAIEVRVNICIEYSVDCLGISPTTITILMQKKVESDYFLNIFQKIIDYANVYGSSVFTYDHLYHLVLQIWMELPHAITIEFRKKIISYAFSENLPSEIIDKIETDVSIWFANLDRNPDITEMINWLCEIDKTGKLVIIRRKYENAIKETKEVRKEFQKRFNITPEEYDLQQERAKCNGLCKFVRDGHRCSYGGQCSFYHGRIENTYGVQPCRNGFRCQHLKTGECRFFHQASPTRKNSIAEFYNSFKRVDGIWFLVPMSEEETVDKKRLKNPFIILQKHGRSENYVRYTIPLCKCSTVNEFGTESLCNKPVKFMSLKNRKISSFYCSYEHMMTKEPRCVSYHVKQNILHDKPRDPLMDTAE